jgi:hypothetical protein
MNIFPVPATDMPAIAWFGLAGSGDWRGMLLGRQLPLCPYIMHDAVIAS